MSIFTCKKALSKTTCVSIACLIYFQNVDGLFACNFKHYCLKLHAKSVVVSSICLTFLHCGLLSSHTAIYCLVNLYYFD